MQTPQQLHYEFLKFGRIRHSLKNKMLAILPDIHKSGIWKKYAGSIVEYCGKYGDIARTTVIKRLRLEENLVDKPFLRAAIEHVGVHKVAMVAKIATVETDKSYAEKVLDMSKLAVQGMSKEVHVQRENNKKSDSRAAGLFDAAEKTYAVEQKPKCNAVPTLKKIELDADASFLFMKLKAKFAKYMSDAKFLKLILEKVDDQTAVKTKSPGAKKSLVKNSCADGESFIGDTLKKGMSVENKKPVTRHVLAQQKREEITKTNGRCMYPNCNNPYDVIHHTDRFSQSKSHKSIVLLCKIHHEFAHNNVIEGEKLGTCEWRMSVLKNPSSKISQADVLYRIMRQKVTNRL